MSVLVTYPATLPGPSRASIAPAERRLLSDLPGVQQVRGIQRDYLAVQDLEWDQLSAAQAAIFQDWWQASLEFGLRWFASTWPSSQGWTSVTRRFLAPPKWAHLPTGLWRVSAQCEVRGRGLAPFLPDPPSAWNPNDIISSGGLPTLISLTSSNRISTRVRVGTDPYEGGVRGALSHSTSGKWYLELKILSTGSPSDTQNLTLGLVDNTQTNVLSRPPPSPDSDYTRTGCLNWVLAFTRFDSAIGAAVLSSAAAILYTTSHPPGAGDVYGFAWDVGTSVKVYVNGALVLTIATTFAGVLFPYMSAGRTLVNGPDQIGNGESVLICTSASQQAYAAPSGFAAWG